LVDTFNNIEKLEADLWEAADNLRANSKLTSSDYFMPVLGVIFLRHAANRFDAADASFRHPHHAQHLRGCGDGRDATGAFKVVDLALRRNVIAN
jgi:hypothetical protein